MKKFLQTRVVEARPMRRGEYNALTGLEQLTVNEGKEEGYLCETGTHITWLPKSEFEKYSTLIGDNKIEKFTLENMIVKKEVKTSYPFGGDKPFTELWVQLSNGMIINESTTCVDHKNYSEEIGTKICTEKMEQKLWFGLGFALSMAQGIKK